MSPLGINIFNTPAARLAAGSGFAADCAADDLIYFLLNVGDGDSQVLLIPDGAGGRTMIVVDVRRFAKTDALISSLANAGLISQTSRIALVVATHPHADHIAGLPRFLKTYAALIDEVWEPAYYVAGSGFGGMMEQIRASGLRHGQPTSGMTRWIGQAKVLVLSPGISLRNRYDTYGIDVNNASISLKVEFPGRQITERNPDGTYTKATRRSLILGADAQTLSWAQVMIDFPQLAGSDAPVAKALSTVQGFEPLKAEVFKVPHHGSKNGLNLELVTAIKPALSLISCQKGGVAYNFPHRVAVESLREGLEERAKSGAAHSPDYDLGIHYTFDQDDQAQLLGSMAVVMSPGGRKRNLWRFGDNSDQKIDLSKARRFD